VGGVSKTGTSFQNWRRFPKVGGISKTGASFQNQVRFPKLVAVSKTGEEYSIIPAGSNNMDILENRKDIPGGMSFLT
jgi:hypothetical protein